MPAWGFSCAPLPLTAPFIAVMAEAVVAPSNSNGLASHGLEAILEKDEISFENVLDARRLYREEINELSRQLRRFKETCKEEGLEHLKAKIAAKTSAGSADIAKEFDAALDTLLSEKTDREQEVSIQLIDLNRQLKEIKMRREKTAQLIKDIEEQEADLATRLLNLENADIHLKNIESNMVQRQASIQKKSAELFRLEEDLRLLKADISEEIGDLGGEELLGKLKAREADVSDLVSEKESTLSHVQFEPSAVDLVKRENAILTSENAELQRQIALLKDESAAKDLRLADLEAEQLRIISREVSDATKAVTVPASAAASASTAPGTSPRRGRMERSHTLHEGGAVSFPNPSRPLLRHQSASGQGLLRGAKGIHPRDMSFSYPGRAQRRGSSETDHDAPKSAACAVM